MGSINDWDNKALLKNWNARNVSYEMMVQGIGLMNAEVADLAMLMVEHYQTEMGGHACTGRSADLLKTITPSEFLSLSFRTQKRLIDYATDMFGGDPEALRTVFEGRNYFIHKFRVDFVCDQGILSDRYLMLKGLITMVGEQIERFAGSIEQARQTDGAPVAEEVVEPGSEEDVPKERSFKKGEVKAEKKKVPKRADRTLVVDETELRGFIKDCIVNNGEWTGDEYAIDVVKLASMVNKKYPGLDYAHYCGENRFSTMLVKFGFIKD